MTTTTRPGPADPGDWPTSTQVAVFQESLRGVVRRAEVAAPPGDDRLECAVAAENVLPSTDGVDGLCGCVLADLRIAVDVGATTADGGWAGVVRSGRVLVEGLGPLTVLRGEFELFPRVAADARRMRYRLWLRDPGGAPWYLRGTKLVANEVGGGLMGRIWTETTTLYVVIFPLDVGSAGPLAARPGGPAYTGVVRVRPADFARQIASLRGEPGPAGGPRALGRLASAFWSVIAEVYLHGRAETAFAPGIDAAFGDEPAGRSVNG